MLFKSSKLTAIVVFLSLMFTSVTSISCGSSETNTKQNESEESAAYLPLIFYVIVIVSTGMTIRSMIKTDADCMRELRRLKQENPNTKYSCEQRSFRGR